MRRRRLVLLTLLLAVGPIVNGCNSAKPELPSQEKIQQQLKRDAAMREAEDRFEKEKGAGKR
jgi:hypothetical protein